MTRREEIEDIIIGTLLNSNKENDYYEQVRYCVTADMFSNGKNRRIYEIIVKMRKDGLTDTCPSDIYAYNSSLSCGFVAYMCELATDYYFFTKKLKYNRWINLNDTSIHKRYTNVSFDDYVSRLIKLAFEHAAE